MLNRQARHRDRLAPTPGGPPLDSTPKSPNRTATNPDGTAPSRVAPRHRDTLGHRGRKGDPLYRIRRLLLVAHERLTDRGWERIEEGLRLGDPAGEVGAAYLAKELLREVYATRSPKLARRRLVRFYRRCHTSDIAELARLAKTIRSWENEIVAYHHTGLTNAATEGTTLLIKKIKRVGHGFRNFENYRLRLLLHCGSRGNLEPSHQCEAINQRWSRRGTLREVRFVAWDRLAPVSCSSS